MTGIETLLQSSEIDNLITLYRFEYQGETLLYTSYPEAVENAEGTETFEPIHLVRGNITHDLTLTPKPLSITIEPLDILKTINTFGLDAAIMTVKVYFAELNQEGKFEVFEEIYRGELDGIQFNNGTGLFELEFNQGELKNLDNDCLKMTIQKWCNNALFDGLCGLSQVGHEVSAVISFVSGNVIKSATFSGYADQWFYLGESKLTKSGRTQRIMIIDHQGDTIKAQFPFADLAVGDTLKVYPGCNKQAATCRVKFNNIAKFNGAAYMQETEDEE